MINQSFAEVFFKHKKRLTIIACWLIIAAILINYYRSIDYDTQLLAVQLVDLFTSPLGIFIYVLAYSIRSLVGFSALVLSVAAGFLYGFVPGVLLVVIASNISSAINYHLGKTVFASSSNIDDNDSGIRSKIRKKPFQAVLIARLSYFPYDLLSFISGALKIDFKQFMVATAIGSIPGTLAVVSFGTSIENITNFNEFSLDPFYIGLSIGLIIVSFFISKLVKKYSTTTS